MGLEHVVVAVRCAGARRRQAGERLASRRGRWPRRWPERTAREDPRATARARAKSRAQPAGRARSTRAKLDARSKWATGSRSAISASPPPSTPSASSMCQRPSAVRRRVAGASEGAGDASHARSAAASAASATVPPSLRGRVDADRMAKGAHPRARAATGRGPVDGRAAREADEPGAGLRGSGRVRGVPARTFGVAPRGFGGRRVRTSERERGGCRDAQRVSVRPGAPPGPRRPSRWRARDLTGAQMSRRFDTFFARLV